jgi:hypothetical protein
MLNGPSLHGPGNLCVGCNSTLAAIDQRASSVFGIRMDMRDVGIPVAGGQDNYRTVIKQSESDIINVMIDDE